MNYKKVINIDETLLSKIIETAYGDANFITRKKILKLAEEHLEVRNLLDEYSQTARTVSNIKEYDCPADIISSVENKLNVSKKDSTLISELSSIYFHRPFATTFGAAMIICSIIFSLFMHNENEIKQKEAFLAEQQVKQSFAIVSKVLKRSEVIIRDEIFNTRIGQPLKKGVEEVNKIL